MFVYASNTGWKNKGWLQDNKSEDDFRYEMYVNAADYVEECDSKYMVCLDKSNLIHL